MTEMVLVVPVQEAQREPEVQPVAGVAADSEEMVPDESASVQVGVIVVAMVDIPVVAVLNGELVAVVVVVE